jgi:hypothetical protein
VKIKKKTWTNQKWSIWRQLISCRNITCQRRESIARRSHGSSLSPSPKHAPGPHTTLLPPYRIDWFSYEIYKPRQDRSNNGNIITSFNRSILVLKKAQTPCDFFLLSAPALHNSRDF